MITANDIKDFEDYQRESWKTAKETAQGANYLFAGLSGEVGEVCSLFAKAVRDGCSREKYEEALVKELGDVLWFISGIASLHSLSLADIAKMNIGKLRDRMQRNAIGGSGDNR